MCLGVPGKVIALSTVDGLAMGTVDFGGMAFDLNYTGVVSADNIQLTLDFMGMPMPFTVKKTN